ncbi:hypothetical protein SAY86_004306 [Trapa natans]|uniref:Uncharacterized protein n=1 Tax=Trapa natans TaxID=22666 RepID=A0AAN7MFE5_TRANT|nr:hypothetical protein SAY86_004306 [Trapa natans]
MEANVGLRKGEWTEEEDASLRNCIEKYGEGKWHQVPLRAGLNRCKKNCRLRWLNYLRPNINRGPFQEDEVDLIFRLHKLLGNRWSLIAGRLPGRTPNDVKNYWNTHLKKTRLASHEKQKSNMAKVEVIKPRPKILKNFSWIVAGEPTTSTEWRQPQLVASSENEINWWENLLVDNQLAIVGEGATSGTNIRNGVVEEHQTREAVSNENWLGNDWSIDVLDYMTLNCLELLDGNMMN